MSTSLNDVLDECINILEKMTEEERKKFADDYWTRVEKQKQEQVECTLKYLDFLDSKQEIVEQAKRIINALDKYVWVEHYNDKVIVLLFEENQKTLVLELNGTDEIRAYIRIPDDNPICIYPFPTEAEIPEVYNKFLQGAYVTWKEYCLRPFKAIQWTGDNLDEVRALVDGDPDSACWVGEETHSDRTYKVLYIHTNIYYEDCPPKQIAYSGDYIVSWGDRFKVFHERFFNEFFEESGSR